MARTLYYEMGGDDIHPADDFEYYPDDAEVEEVIEEELNKMSKEELIELIRNNIDITDLEEYFEAEITEAFRDCAEKEYWEEY